MSMLIVWTRIRRVAGIAALMVRLPSSSMVDATTIPMSWMCYFLPFKGRLIQGNFQIAAGYLRGRKDAGDASVLFQGDRKGLPYYTWAGLASRSVVW
jgi:hypothetical protein